MILIENTNNIENSSTVFLRMGAIKLTLRSLGLLYYINISKLAENAIKIKLQIKRPI